MEEKKAITEEMKEHEKWYEEAKKVTVETLPEFVRHLTEDYQHDYGTICHALSACGLAGTYAIENSPCGGITGFQARFVMWGFIRHWMYSSNKCGLKIVDYDNMLYPQYEDKFGKYISKDIFESLKKEARKNLDERTVGAHPDVVAHWQSIVGGKVPYGYEIRED